MFSEKYQKMCERANNLQKNWKPQIKDFYLKKGSSALLVIESDKIKNEIEGKIVNYIWIPGGASACSR